MSSIFTPELTAALVAHDRMYDVKEFAKVANALLAEGIVLLRAHAGEWPAIERYCAAVEKVRAQYRAAKEAPDGAPPGFRIVDRSGPGVPMPASDAWVRHARFADGRIDTTGRVRRWGRPRWLGERWKAGEYDILEPIPAPAPEPTAPPDGVPPSAPVTVVTGGVPAGYRTKKEWQHGPGCGCRFDSARLCPKRVRVDTARSVPRGPVPDEPNLAAPGSEPAPTCSVPCLSRTCPRTCELDAGHSPDRDHTHWSRPNEAGHTWPASEPAVWPLSEELRVAAEDLKRLLQYRDGDGRLHSPAHGVLGAWKHLVRRFEGVAALEAELAEAKRRVVESAVLDVATLKPLAAACAEVEQLRERLKNSQLGRAMALDDLNTKTRHLTWAAAEVRQLKEKLAEQKSYTDKAPAPAKGGE